MKSPFADIMQAVVRGIPGAIGGAFAARDGEIVDAFVNIDPTEWAIITAHYGVILSHVQSALHTFHHGEARLMLLTHDRTDIIMHSVCDGYFALVATRHPTPLALAIRTISEAVVDLREEMG